MAGYLFFKVFKIRLKNENTLWIVANSHIMQYGALNSVQRIYIEGYISQIFYQRLNLGCETSDNVTCDQGEIKDQNWMQTFIQRIKFLIHNYHLWKRIKVNERVKTLNLPWCEMLNVTLIIAQENPGIMRDKACVNITCCDMKRT